MPSYVSYQVFSENTYHALYRPLLQLAFFQLANQECIYHILYTNKLKVSSNIEWRHGEPRDITNRQLRNIKIVVPDDANLDHAQEELKWIKGFLEPKGMNLEHIMTLERMKEILKIGGFDLLHISTHGRYDKFKTSDSSIQLKDKKEFKVSDLVGSLGFGRYSPIVILNACETARQDFSLTGIQSWASEFIRNHVSVFIGTLWKVNSEIALKFSQGLYTNIANGKPLGEAVKEARKNCIHICSEKCNPNCKDTEDPSWLSYQLY
jgi:CHAT domain-containing protein